MRVVLLAAGQATRLRPLTDDRPKCLLDVGGEAILLRALRILVSRGLTRFTIVDGYRGAMIRDAVAAAFPRLAVTFARNAVFASTNNAWSLMLADGAPDEGMMLLDGDIVFDAGVIDRLLAHPAANRLGLRTEGAVGAEEMKVRLGPDGRVADLSKAMDPVVAAGESVGIEVFGPAFVADLFPVLRRRLQEEQRVNEYYEAAFVELIRSGHGVTPIDLAGLACREVDTAADLEAARREFTTPC